jgi:hypothetical protein
MATRTTTPNKELRDIFEKYHYDRDIVKKSQTWFTQQILLLSKKRITPNQVVRNQGASHVSNNIIPGKMYMFFYDPKTKATLPYYDRFPLVFPFSTTQDGFIGLNMHYLPHKLRFTLMDRLLVFKNNDKFDESTKLRYSWAAINGMAKFAMAKPCVKRYLKDHLRSPLVNIVSQDWATAMMLPVERFVGASNAAVWADSRNKI